MSHSSLADFLEELDDVGELARVSVEVDPELEIAEITRRVAAEGGPALLFERVAGRSLAVVTNLLGTEDRVCRALEIESLDEIAERTESLIEKNTPHNWFDRLKISADEAGANKFRAKSVKAGPCQQVVRLGRDVDLTTLPAIKQWPLETNPAITGALVISQHSGDETRSATLCPLQVLDANRLAVVDDGHSNLARHWSRALAAHEKLPVVDRCWGVIRPASWPRTSSSTTGSISFTCWACLRGKALDLVKCRTHSMEVPAEADMVLEGYLDPESAAGRSRSGRHRRQLLSSPATCGGAARHGRHASQPSDLSGDRRQRPAGRSGRAGGGPRADAAAGGPHGGPRRSRRAPAGLRRFARLGLGLDVASAIRSTPAKSPAPCGVRRPCDSRSSWCWSTATLTCTTCRRCWPKSAPT